MTPSPELGEPEPGWLVRFTRGERWIHRSLGVLMGICLVTAAMLYVGPLAQAVGRRDLVGWVHVVSGYLLLGPLIAVIVLRAARIDAGRLNRFTPVDWEWLRRRDRGRAGLAVGKFNAGQKLNAAFTAGAIIVFVLTGSIMRFNQPFSDAWRTGATFVHDWLSVAVVIVLVGHVWMASRDPWARHGLRTGVVPEGWARREHRGWADEVR